MLLCYYVRMRTTINLNDTLFRTVKVRAADIGSTFSDIVEDAIKYQLLEDFEDIDDALSRKDEPELLFDKLVATYRAEGLI
jgi:hypothetical protein